MAYGCSRVRFPLWLEEHERGSPHEAAAHAPFLELSESYLPVELIR